MNNNYVKGTGLGRRGVRNRRLGRVDSYLDEARIRDLDLYDVPFQRHRMRCTYGVCRIDLRNRIHRFPHHM